MASLLSVVLKAGIRPGVIDELTRKVESLEQKSRCCRGPSLRASTLPRFLQPAEQGMCPVRAGHSGICPPPSTTRIRKSDAWVSPGPVMSIAITVPVRQLALCLGSAPARDLSRMLGQRSAVSLLIGL